MILQDYKEDRFGLVYNHPEVGVTVAQYNDVGILDTNFEGISDPDDYFKDLSGNQLGIVEVYKFDNESYEIAEIGRITLDHKFEEVLEAGAVEELAKQIFFNLCVTVH